MHMSVGRDYRTNSRYEYVIFGDDEKIITREGFFNTYTQAKRAGYKKAKELDPLTGGEGNAL